MQSAPSTCIGGIGRYPVSEKSFHCVDVTLRSRPNQRRERLQEALLI